MCRLDRRVTRRAATAVRRAAVIGAIALVAGGCSNFFPNASNVVLPSGAIAFELHCGPVARARCEARARELEKVKRTENPAVRVVKLELTDDRGSYTITFSDGNTESLIVD